MKPLSWALLVVGIVVFFAAPDPVTGWTGIMAAVTGIAMILYRWSQDTGYLEPADEASRPVEPRTTVKQYWK